MTPGGFLLKEPGPPPSSRRLAGVSSDVDRGRRSEAAGRRQWTPVSLLGILIGPTQRRRGRAAECSGFENRRAARHQGFESSRLRHPHEVAGDHKGLSECTCRGRRGSPSPGRSGRRLYPTSLSQDGPPSILSWQTRLDRAGASGESLRSFLSRVAQSRRASDESGGSLVEYAGLAPRSDPRGDPAEHEHDEEVLC